MLGFNYLVWIGIVSWVVVPLTAFFVARWLWRRSQTDLSRLLALVAGLAIFLTPAAISNARKAYYDRQVRALCTKDGGVRVYETVSLPVGKYEELERLNFVLPDKSRAHPMDEYYGETERRYLRKGNPQVSRRQYRIIRRSDQKVLGELVFYGRGGGDLPGPWHGSGFTCPEPTRVSFELAVFRRGDE